MNARSVAGFLGVLLGLVACERQPVEVISSGPPPDQLQQTYWPVADFTLTERSERPVMLADLKGKVWVADFFYSTCPGPCPMLSSRLSELQEHVGNDERVRLVSISTDPEKDTPEVLRQYAQRFHASERWLFLTGPKAAIQELALNGFKLPFAENPAGPEPIIHSTRLVLVDQAGTIRGLYEGADKDSAARLMRDLHRLLDSKP
ncbi:MAG: SCO family protein [Chthoniobacteraceae bacterium]